MPSDATWARLCRIQLSAVEGDSEAFSGTPYSEPLSHRAQLAKDRAAVALDDPAASAHALGYQHVLLAFTALVQA